MKTANNCAPIFCTKKNSGAREQKTTNSPLRVNPPICVLADGRLPAPSDGDKIGLKNGNGIGGIKGGRAGRTKATGPPATWVVELVLGGEKWQMGKAKKSSLSATMKMMAFERMVGWANWMEL
jgi:hypothetical protein